MVQQNAASQQGNETQAVEDVLHRLAEAIRLEATYAKRHSPNFVVSLADVPLIKMRELIEIAFRSRKFVPGSTVFQRVLYKEGVLTEDLGFFVKVSWRWPVDDGKSTLEDKFHICLSHERRSPLEYVLPGVNLSAFLHRFVSEHT